MSGLLSALLLQRNGWRVDIYERAGEELSGRGAGIVAQPELIARLKGLGLKTDDLGVHIARRQIVDARGEVTHAIDCSQVATAWERVFRLLRRSFPDAHYHSGKALKGFTQSADSVTAHFADGDAAAADVLVGADGIRSTVRQNLEPDVTPLYAGYVAWRALVDEARIPRETHAAIFDIMSFGLPPGEQFLSYPVAGPDNDLRAGHRRTNVIWYRPADEASKLKWLLTDAQGRTHDISIPPALIRAEAIAEMHDAAERLLAPSFRALVRLIDEPLLQPIYDLMSPRLAFGRVALIGDAAFVARPHVGAGVSKAADDAAALADALAAHDDVGTALTAFEAARVGKNRRIIEWARHLGAYLQATRTEAEKASAGRHATDAAVIRETATLDFLYA
ncbi:MAG: FAD-dependent monooxygenase [Proteobacteria bacterium]|nr:FAD-dependent monooxygenase [Pseudomonadota bacterium]